MIGTITGEGTSTIGMMTGNVGDLDRFSGQRIGDVDRLGADDRDAVAAVADMIDGEELSHGAHR